MSVGWRSAQTVTGSSPDYDSGLREWNTDTTQLDETLATKTGPNGVTSVAVCPDATIVAAGHADGAVELWDPSTRKQLPGSPLHGHTGTVLGVASGVAHQLASGGMDDLRLWDTPPANQPLHQRRCQTSSRAWR